MHRLFLLDGFFYIFTWKINGGAQKRAEIIPFEPESVKTDVGKIHDSFRSIFQL